MPCVLPHPIDSFKVLEVAPCQLMPADVGFRLLKMLGQRPFYYLVCAHKAGAHSLTHRWHNFTLSNKQQQHRNLPVGAQGCKRL